MNKSIKELAEKAGGIKFSNRFSGTNMDVDAFAKLLLKECINEIDLVSAKDYADDSWDTGYETGLAQAIAVIKERFGPLE